MKNKLYTNNTIKPSKIDNYRIDGVRCCHLNDRALIVTDFVIPLCFPIHVYTDEYSHISRAYLQVGNNYVHIPINPLFKETTIKAKRLKLNINFRRKADSKYRDKHIYNKHN